MTWRSHAHLLYANWLNYYVYQATPFDLEELPATDTPFSGWASKKSLDAVPPAFLGFIQGLVGGRDELLGRGRVLRARRRAYADRDGRVWGGASEGAVLEAKRFGGLAHGLAELERAVDAAVREEYREFVAREAGADLALAYQRERRRLRPPRSRRRRPGPRTRR